MSEKPPMSQKLEAKGFSVVEVLIVVLVVAALGLGGFFVWQRSKDDTAKKTNTNTSQDEQKQTDDEPATKDDTATWASVTTQGKAFSMKVPDGWKLTSYPGDFLGSMDVVHKDGIPAVIETSDTEYVGHSLRFRASVAELDDAGLGPQWESPQPGLEESTQDFSIGTLKGKRFKAVFSGELNQTLYEYVFDLGNNKKLNIVYSIYHNEGEKDDVAMVDKAVRTIRIR